ncbi:hypothetical protein BDV59DRAFT_202262 [Aspergillus ambiguus]|uniref:uncharacterized protein n=1 Tax=Aspergillus ambiguus TaxID=176160 RepID=UPI003CCC93AA
MSLTPSPSLFPPLTRTPPKFLPLDSAATAIPSPVVDYAPLVWLHSQDPFRPSGIAQQLMHTTPMVHGEPVQGAPSPLTLENLDRLNLLGNTSVFLTSQEGSNADPPPAWFRGVSPDATGETVGAVSACVIVVDHHDGTAGSSGTLDAFYFYFFAYNRGNTVLQMEFGDHVGDWEHTMIRFSEGVPQTVWYSEHARGLAVTYAATEKQGKRPVAYAANGTHAVYAVAGSHDYTIPWLDLPFGLVVVDHTDQGVLWDPLLSVYAYRYDARNRSFQPYDPSYPVQWLDFNGRWGDDALPAGLKTFGLPKQYVGGPSGPKFKALVRTEVCPSERCPTVNATPLYQVMIYLVVCIGISWAIVQGVRLWAAHHRVTRR